MPRQAPAPARARPTRARPTPRPAPITRLAVRPARVRWDRIGRLALLLVLLALVYLYAGAAHSYWATLQVGKDKRAEVQRLERENARLRARKRALNRISTLETEARKLGMVRPDEQPYVVHNLPRG
jgi:cell division protein FtsB